MEMREEPVRQPQECSAAQQPEGGRNPGGLPPRLRDGDRGIEEGPERGRQHDAAGEAEHPVEQSPTAQATHHHESREQLARRVDALMGKYAHAGFTSDELFRERQEDRAREEGPFKP